ncbi:MAG: DUF881 domain-containing protein [Bacillota bacterium]
MKDHKRLYFFIIALLVGLFTTLQIKSNITFQGIVTIPKLMLMQNDIENLQKETKKLAESTNMLSSKLEEYEESLSDNGNIYGKLYDELLNTRDIAGMVKVEGPGVIITLSDGVEEVTNDMLWNWIVVHDDDVLAIVNELKNAGAEAISINDERLIATSSIRCGGPTILIDGKRHAIPFVIKAIGDPQKLEAISTAPGSFFEFLKYRGVSIELHKVDNIIINGYTGNKKLTFQKKVEGGDKK